MTPLLIFSAILFATFWGSYRFKSDGLIAASALWLMPLILIAAPLVVWLNFLVLAVAGGVCCYNGMRSNRFAFTAIAGTALVYGVALLGCYPRYREAVALR